VSSIEDQFLVKISRGGLISQDEYDQLGQDLPPEMVAGALARRFDVTGELRMLVEAARLYARAGHDYEVLEVCSRAPRSHELQHMVERTLPRIRNEYPEIKLIGKLMDTAFLVIDLETGKMVRFPPLMPAT
jgi:hypothetical protein